MRSPRRRVVVTGVGAVAPNGIGMPAYRAALQRGQSGVRRHEKLRALNFACQVAAVPELSEEEVLRTIPHHVLDKLTEAMVYATLATVECAQQSGEHVDMGNGYLDTPVNWKTGAIIGCGMGGGLDIVLDEFPSILNSARQRDPGRGMWPLGCDIVPKVMGSSVSVIVGRVMGLGSQVGSSSAACLTGTLAIFEGYKQILLEYADSMYVGGVEGSHQGTWAGFDAMRYVLCSRFNEKPEMASRPMSASASGFVPGGGGAVLRLEALDSALARRAPILCELTSAFCNSGGHRDGGTMTYPNPEGVVRCIRKTLEDAGVDPSEISLINGHLTATRGDPLEVHNWLEALKLPPERFPLIQSTKSMIGHCLGASGALEAAAVVDQIAHGYVHPSINCEDVHADIRLIAGSIPAQRMDKRLEYALKASFGFGDVNGCLLFKRWDGDTHTLER